MLATEKARTKKSNPPILTIIKDQSSSFKNKTESISKKTGLAYNTHPLIEMKDQSFGLSAFTRKGVKMRRNLPPSTWSNKKKNKDKEDKLSAFEQYRANRENGLSSDSPSREFPGDGKYSWVKVDHWFRRCYKAGPKDTKWMEERDHNYLKRIEHERDAEQKLQEREVQKQELLAQKQSSFKSKNKIEKIVLPLMLEISTDVHQSPIMRFIETNVESKNNTEALGLDLAKRIENFEIYLKKEYPREQKQRIQHLRQSFQRDISGLYQTISQHKKLLKTEVEDLDRRQAELADEFAKLQEKKKNEKQSLDNINPNNTRLENELEVIKNKLENIELEQLILHNASKTAIARLAATKEFKKNPNLFLYYHSIQVYLEAVLVSYKAISGGAVQHRSGKVGSAAEDLGILGDFIGLIPVAGAPVAAVISLINKGIEEIDEARMINKANRVTKLATMTEIAEIVESVARQLTYMYAPQLKQLADFKQFVCLEEGIRRNKNNKNFIFSNKNKVKDWVLDRTIPLPADHMAKCATLCIIAELGEVAKECEQQDQRLLALDKRFFDIIVALRPDKPSSIINKLSLSFRNKFIKNNRIKDKKVLDKKIIECNEKLNNFFDAKVLTADGKKWSVFEVYTKPGIKVNYEMGGYKAYYGNGTDHIKYGYCNGTDEIAKKRGFQNTECYKSPELIVDPKKDNLDVGQLTKINETIYNFNKKEGFFAHTNSLITDLTGKINVLGEEKQKVIEENKKLREEVKVLKTFLLNKYPELEAQLQEENSKPTTLYNSSSSSDKNLSETGMVECSGEAAMAQCIG